MDATWFETVFRRKPHPVLRMLGNLLLGAVQVYWVIVMLTQLHSGWRWFAAPVGLLSLVFAGRGVAVAARDLRRRGAEPPPR
ncbi:hypothetical protein [Streptomyces sp. NPDC096934]|uniref:hypothetical protein n=1 Tax=Streptomyces sp. NPDC096934 TaxID=3155551 RepID=UPI003323BF20